jgi:hypothetical protein
MCRLRRARCCNVLHGNRDSDHECSAFVDPGPGQRPLPQALVAEGPLRLIKTAISAAASGGTPIRLVYNLLDGNGLMRELEDRFVTKMAILMKTFHRPISLPRETQAFYPVAVDRPCTRDCLYRPSGRAVGIEADTGAAP